MHRPAYPQDVVAAVALTAYAIVALGALAYGRWEPAAIGALGVALAALISAKG